MSFEQEGVFSKRNTFHILYQRINPLCQNQQKTSHSYRDRKRGFAQQNLFRPHLTPIREAGALINDTNCFNKVYADNKENQPAAQSLYQQI